MKIAVALHNEKLAQHFSEAEVFAVFHVSEGVCGAPVYRIRDHAMESPDDSDHQSHGDHEGIVKILNGCNAVIVGGMGHRAALALQQNGIEPVISAEMDEPQALVQKLATGTLSIGSFHRCCHG